MRRRRLAGDRRGIANGRDEGGLMRTVTLGGVPGRVVLGEGIPKTIVPLTASNLEALLAECAAAAECDIVEWRIDHFAGFRAAPPGDAPPRAP
ncbi:MAG: type I 3-dehydroquinate dehydratase, partial [Peptidiphaga sp.]